MLTLFTVSQIYSRLVFIRTANRPRTIRGKRFLPNLSHRRLTHANRELREIVNFNLRRGGSGSESEGGKKKIETAESKRANERASEIRIRNEELSKEKLSHFHVYSFCGTASTHFFPSARSASNGRDYEPLLAFSKNVCER